MIINATGDPGIFDVPSESGGATVYTVDVRGKGVDGDPHTCTCTRYAINKNRAGGAGFQGDYCKHLREVTSQSGVMLAQRTAKEEETAAADEFERIRVASSLEHMLKELEDS